jgi:hypothetical protein
MWQEVSGSTRPARLPSPRLPQRPHVRPLAASCESDGRRQPAGGASQTRDPGDGAPKNPLRHAATPRRLNPHGLSGKPSAGMQNTSAQLRARRWRPQAEGDAAVLGHGERDSTTARAARTSSIDGARFSRGDDGPLQRHTPVRAQGAGVLWRVVVQAGGIGKQRDGRRTPPAARLTGAAHAGMACGVGRTTAAR